MPTTQELEAQIAELKAKLAAANQPRALKLKVSEKGAVSLYGLNARFPVTLYSQQWERVLDYATTIREFIAENKSKLSVKDSD